MHAYVVKLFQYPGAEQEEGNKTGHEMVQMIMGRAGPSNGLEDRWMLMGYFWFCSVSYSGCGQRPPVVIGLCKIVELAWRRSCPLRKAENNNDKERPFAPHVFLKKKALKPSIPEPCYPRSPKRYLNVISSKLSFKVKPLSISKVATLTQIRPYQRPREEFIFFPDKSEWKR
ncbi:hypothetical protein Dimus_030643 [Dionaea muscipula]